MSSHNPWVEGSSPSGPKKKLLAVQGVLLFSGNNRKLMKSVLRCDCTEGCAKVSPKTL
jgi:hypothetical protein